MIVLKNLFKHFEIQLTFSQRQSTKSIRSHPSYLALTLAPDVASFAWNLWRKIMVSIYVFKNTDLYSVKIA